MGEEKKTSTRLQNVDCEFFDRTGVAEWIIVFWMIGDGESRRVAVVALCVRPEHHRLDLTDSQQQRI